MLQYRYPWGNKCPDKKSDKCYKCKYCVAQMQADDAAKLLRVFDEKMSQKYKK